MSAAAAGAAAELVGVTKRYGGARPAVDGVDLRIEEGEFFSILGPSGCGKTTSLRMLGGFVRPDEGEIRLGGASVDGVPPHKRNVNTVFQSYALFGHLSVADNVGFGLRRRKVRGEEMRRRVDEMLRVVSLAERRGAMPSELSGGQQQRVALARALVNMPELLLLDEPLGALDLKLRRQMQVELKQIQREVGIAFAYVTHDQEEALTMSDRIAVMNDGKVLQVDTPTTIYNNPASLFVAQFIGSTNALEGSGDGATVQLACGARLVAPAPGTGVADGPLTACVRPEKVILSPAGDDAPGAVTGTVVESVYVGSGTTYKVDVNATSIEVLEANDSGAAAAIPVGSRVRVGWRPEDCLIFDGNGKAAGRCAEDGTKVPQPTRSRNWI
ncbi:MAG: ABC transporter ATP-binding protein [Actinobacteria bacterium]|nr:ABC transporter ATP-binding protein [Actinomycetota bacterium]